MNRIGWYNTQDNTGGNSYKLRVKNGELVDERPVHGYYKKHNNEFLNAFEQLF